MSAACVHGPKPWWKSEDSHARGAYREKMAQRMRIRVKCKNSTCCPFHRQQTRGEVAGRAFYCMTTAIIRRGESPKKRLGSRHPTHKPPPGSDDSRFGRPPHGPLGKPLRFGLFTSTYFSGFYIMQILHKMSTFQFRAGRKLLPGSIFMRFRSASILSSKLI